MSIAFPIIISLAVAALFVLRFVDRNNRSLEKIKRYTDKVKGDLDKYVGERTDELKNIGIEVDVHQKASREIIKKIESFEQRLAEKNDTLENVFSRIEDYDRAIADLVSMTERVDENLLRLKQESEFVEEVSIRLSKAKNSVSALEKAIPEVERYFEQSNNEALQSLWNGVKGDLESEMAGLSEKMNDVKFSVGEFSDFVRHLEDKRVEMEASALESLQKDIESAYNSAEMKADQLKDDIKQDVAGIMEQLQVSSASLKEFFDNRDGEIKGRFEEYSQKADAIEDKCRNFLSDADKALSNGSRNLKELVARADSAAAQLDEKVSIVDSLNQRVEEYQQRVAELDAAASGFDKQIAALKKDSAFVDTVSKRVKEASAEFASIEKKIPTLLADFSDTNRKQLEILSSSVRSDIEQKLENVESRVSSSAVLAEEYCGKVSRAFVQAEQDSEVLTSRVKDDISAIYNEIRASHGEFLNQDISKVRELRESLDTEIKKHLSAFNEAGTYTINSINDTAERQSKVIEEAVAHAGSSINEMKTGYREFADKVNSDIDNSRKEIQELYQSSESIRAELTNKSQEISEMYEKIQAYDSSLAQLKTLHDETNLGLAQLKKESSFISRTSDSVKKLSGDLESISKKIPTIVTDFGSANKNALDSVLEDVQGKVQLMFTEYSGRVEKAERDVTDFNVFVSNFNDNQQKIIDESASRLKQDTLEVLESAEQRSDDLIKKVTSRTESLYGELDSLLSELRREMSNSSNAAGELKIRIEDGINAAGEKVQAFLDSVSGDVKAREQQINTLFDRAESVRSEIENKSGSIEQMYSKINEYGVMIKDLEELSKETGERLNYLKSESSFVNSVAKRLKNTYSFVTKLEKEIPEIKDEFASQNKAQLEQIWQDAQANVDANVNELSGQINTLESYVNDFSSFIGSLESRRDEMRAESESQSKAIFDSLITETRNRFELFSKEFSDEIDSKQSGMNKSFAELSANIQKTFSQAQLDFEKQDNAWEQRLADFKDRADQIENTYQHNIHLAAEQGRSLQDDVFSALKLSIEERAAEVERDLLSHVGEVGDKVERTNAEIIKMFGEMRSDVSLQRENAVKKLEEVRNEIEQAFECAASDSALRLQQMTEENSSAQQLQTQQLEAFKVASDNSLKEIKVEIEENLSALNKGLEAESQNITLSLNQLKSGSENNLSVFKRELDGKLNSLNNNFISEIKVVEQNLEEFEDSVSYKFNRMDSIVSEVGRFESVMKDYMNSETGRLKSELIDFEKKLESDRNFEVQKAEQVYESFKAGVAGLEHELADLKKRAYDNVSSKLEVLEDTFFTDLRKRTDDMEQNIAEWQNSVASEMERVSSEGVQQRLQLEEFYTDSFAQKVKTLQGDIAQESERLDSQVSRLNLLIDQRFANAEQEVDRQREIIDQALAEMKDDSLNKFSAEFEEYNGSVRTRLGSFSSSLEEKLGTISAGIDVKNDEFKRMIETAQSDMTVWQSKTLQQLNEAKAEVSGKISDLKSSAADSIYEINAEFEREKEGYLKHSALRQQEMEKQLNVINDNIVRLENDLKLRTGEAIQDFSERYTDILNTLDLKSSEIFHKIETDSEEFRKTASDTRTKVNSAREQLFGRIEEKAGTLTVTLNEIDKRLKAFVDQTKVFDKADELKGRLKQDIDTLKSEIDRLKVDRKELRETDKNFQKMRKMEEELNLRLNELLAQRRKVDEMEKDFTRLMETSSSISARLDDVTSGSDMLHSIQAKLRQVDDLVAEVDRKYVRLEHKENLLDSTAQGVDRSFESMEKLEGRIKQVEGNFSKFLMNLKNTSDRISVLSNNKADADAAVNKINSLDSLLSELDGKMSEMQKARTWLAETETRLEQINKSAQENVRIFKSLVESDSAKDARNKASSSDTRALVKKLAHQGWSVAEIAKTTKLSRGEVELILELIPE